MEMHVETNPLLDKLPAHLRQYIKPQAYEQYTPINQAVWRYVMRKNVNYLSQVAHESYTSGLKKTGISIDEIPSMYGMNRILKEIGWAAVAVDGFIPPNAFMEFQAYKVLVIASDIRQLENIEYTPAPDIIHEGAGHAPIIASPDYAEYLRRFGEIGARAISNAHDMNMYEAVRKLSILKEAEGIPDEDVQAAEDEVNRLQEMTVAPSEIALIRNLHWWTVEYGLIGSVDNPKLYGAGLLSSLGESKHCLTDAVKKIPYSIDAAYQEFDITQMQPQLYVTPDFGYLMEVLEEFAETMALRKGGWRGVQKLIDCKQLGSIELNTGLQVSGNFSKMIQDEDNNVVYFETTGPSALAYRNKELIGLGTSHFRKGFSSPLGKLKRSSVAIERMSPRDLKAFEIYEGGINSFEFESGITVTGMITTGTRSIDGTLLAVHFDGCEVSYKGEKLISRKNGPFDMAIGSSIVSAFAGAADHTSFNMVSHVSSTNTIHQELSEEDTLLNSLYKEIRDMRESNDVKVARLEEIFRQLQANFPKDWLASLEVYELAIPIDASFAENIKGYLEAQTKKLPKVAHLITDGLSLYGKPLMHVVKTP
ncbi:aromatic amino acid hydroxylase [Dokdonia sp. Hel_I_53]|uniref:aromatic amino acid hydroxylase n=1 Tax=Dokdonia sp. Hel_I_53 TaxID=1566287 RepID=UPI001198E0C0|nr:aromatic amino acid hydroxylase [Dokdonia sp. Hel_I_53]TVZ52204.1 phenylalanine-4-hydroxylase [Dokdonia sp. Hel_I_53]